MQAINECNCKIINLRDKRNRLQKSGVLSEKEKIELQYTINDLDRTFLQKRNQVKKLDILMQERDGEDFSPYSDEIGMDNIINEPSVP